MLTSLSVQLLLVCGVQHILYWQIRNLDRWSEHQNVHDDTLLHTKVQQQSGQICLLLALLPTISKWCGNIHLFLEGCSYQFPLASSRLMVSLLALKHPLGTSNQTISDTAHTSYQSHLYHLKYCTKKIFVKFFHTLIFCLYEKPLPWNVQNSQFQNEHVLLFPLDDFCLWWRYVFCRINFHLWKIIFLSLFENWFSNHNLWPLYLTDIFYFWDTPQFPERRNAFPFPSLCMLHCTHLLFTFVFTHVFVAAFLNVWIDSIRIIFIMQCLLLSI